MSQETSILKNVPYSPAWERLLWRHWLPGSANAKCPVELQSFIKATRLDRFI